MRVEDQGAVEDISGKLRTLRDKYKMMCEHWLEQTKGLSLAPDGTLIGGCMGAIGSYGGGKLTKIAHLLLAV